MATSVKKSVKEMAKDYYPNLWSIERLKTLVKAGKISADDFKEITGEDYTE